MRICIIMIMVKIIVELSVERSMGRSMVDGRLSVDRKVTLVGRLAMERRPKYHHHHPELGQDRRHERSSVFCVSLSLSYGLLFVPRA
jgi:hypothetical protein